MDLKGSTVDTQERRVNDQNKHKTKKKKVIRENVVIYLDLVPGLASTSGHTLYQAQSHFALTSELKLFHSVYNNGTSTTVFPVKMLGFSEDNLQNFQIIANIMTGDMAVLGSEKKVITVKEATS